MMNVMGTIRSALPLLSSAPLLNWMTSLPHDKFYEVYVCELLAIATHVKRNRYKENLPEQLIRFVLNNFKKSRGKLRFLMSIIITQDKGVCFHIRKSPIEAVKVGCSPIYPHILFCRLFRWPELESKDRIVSVGNCKYKHPKKDRVCLNPFHYEIISNNEFDVGSQMLTMSALPFQPERVHFDQLEYWCQIIYYEYGQKVGDTFYGRNSAVAVDGFCYSNEGLRFCLGNLTNLQRVHENWCRSDLIGDGVVIYHTYSEVYIDNLSNSSIFVHVENNEISPGSNQQLFDNDAFEEILASTLVADYSTVNSLQSMCKIWISFGETWSRRNSVLDIPCCIQIQLVAPLILLDKVLEKYKYSTNNHPSDSE